MEVVIAPHQRRQRGRPCASQVAERDTALLDTAEALFLAHGYQQVSIGQIAATARVAARTIYTRFGDKAALLSAVIDRECRLLCCELDDLAAQQAPLHEKLEGFALLFLQRSMSTKVRLLGADALAERHYHLREKLDQACFQAWRMRIQDLFSSGPWQGRCALRLEPSALTDLFVGCVISDRLPALQNCHECDSELTAWAALAAVQRFMASVAFSTC